MNNLDKQYTDLLQTILDYGVEKKDRTGTGTKSIFGYTIRHNMKHGFPLLTTKKMAWRTMVTELLWFLRGDTNIKYLVDNDCHIWDGDCFSNYLKKRDKFSNKDNVKEDVVINGMNGSSNRAYTQEEFINKIKTDDGFARKWGNLGPVYGRMWRAFDEDADGGIDQIANLINDLKTNPDSRRLLVTAWNPTYLPHQVLPPCHYGFQVYTRELSLDERQNLYFKLNPEFRLVHENMDEQMDKHNVPKRAISLMWNQRSVDTFLGLPFNIASYGLLLEIIAKAVNMVPDELIGNLGDVHLYSNHIEQAKEQIGREFTEEEIQEHLMQSGMDAMMEKPRMEYISKLPKRTRQPFPLPTLNINTEFWPYEGGECGEGPLDATAVFNSFKDNSFCKCLLEEDIQLGNYQSHPSIKAPLSN